MLGIIPKRVIFYNPREDVYVDDCGDYVNNINDLISHNDIDQFQKMQQDMILYTFNGQPIELIYAWEDEVYFYYEENNRLTDSEGWEILNPLEIITPNEFFLLRHTKEDLTVYRPRCRTFDVVYVPINEY